MTAPTNTDAETTPSRAVVVSDACYAGRVLRLTLKRKWFDMIASGRKREEYRTPGKWILSRLEGRDYDVIEFKNGYGPNVPTMLVEYRGWKRSSGLRDWGAQPSVEYATIKLGRVLSLHNT
jgi:hypothetical protein